MVQMRHLSTSRHHLGNKSLYTDIRTVHGLQDWFVYHNCAYVPYFGMTLDLLYSLVEVITLKPYVKCETLFYVCRDNRGLARCFGVVIYFFLT